MLYIFYLVALLPAELERVSGFLGEMKNDIRVKSHTTSKTHIVDMNRLKIGVCREGLQSVLNSLKRSIVDSSDAKAAKDGF